MSHPRTFASIVVLMLITGAAAAASAQSTTSGPASAGPLVLTPIPSSIVFSPDAKLTTANDKAVVLAGGYVGKLIEHSLLVGAGAYWLADHRDDARLWYAGLLVGARVLGSDRLNLSARSLFGVGQGTVFDTLSLQPLRHHGSTFPGRDVRIGYRDDFLVVDPELRLMLALTDALSVNVGAGYRATTAADGLNERLRGATGSVGIQFNIGK